MHAGYPDDPGFLPPPGWDDDHGLGLETTWHHRNAQVSLELQLMRMGFDFGMEVGER